MSRALHQKDGAKFPAKDLTLHEAIHHVFYESGKPFKALADAIGKSAGYCYAAADPNAEAVVFQAGLIVPLTKASGNPAIVHSIARACGGVFVQLHAGHASPDANTAKVLTEVGEYLQTVAAADSDGKVTADEFKATSHQIDDAIEALLAHKLALESRVVATPKTLAYPATARSEGGR